MGYEPFDLKEQLEKIEGEELAANMKAKEASNKKKAMNEDYQSLIKSTGKAKARETARRRSLGYDK